MSKKYKDEPKLVILVFVCILSLFILSIFRVKKNFNIFFSRHALTGKLCLVNQSLQKTRGNGNRKKTN